MLIFIYSCHKITEKYGFKASTNFLFHSLIIGIRWTGVVCYLVENIILLMIFNLVGM